MKLDVIQSAAGAKQPWYAEGLNFTCTQCGNCCGGAPGYVWVNRDDVIRIAAFLKITPEEMVERYCRKVGGRWSLNEGPGPGSAYDCVFLREENVVKRSGQAAGAKLARRYCSIYEVRPLQCRTWPFWRENLTSPATWKHAGRNCHGIDHGRRHFTREQIDSVRDAAEWPENPPTSAAGMAKK
jgi:uncharacterized protein